MCSLVLSLGVAAASNWRPGCLHCYFSTSSNVCCWLQCCAPLGVCQQEQRDLCQPCCLTLSLRTVYQDNAEKPPVILQVEDKRKSLLRFVQDVQPTDILEHFQSTAPPPVSSSCWSTPGLFTFVCAVVSQRRAAPVQCPICSCL